MRKNVKAIVQKMNGRVLTNREASRQADNLRKRMRRSLAKELSEAMGTKVKANEAEKMFKQLSNPTQQASSLYKDIQKSYAVRKEGTKQKQGYSFNIEKQFENIQTFNELRFGRSKLNEKNNANLAQRNKMFIHQINQSTKKDGLSVLNREETKAFYASTMDMWKGLSTADNFNARIMLEFGINDISQIYKLLTSKKLKKDDFDNEAEYAKFVKDNFGFNDVKAFEDFLNDLDKKVMLNKRREIVQEQLQTIRGNNKVGGTTEDTTYNNDDVKTSETSPQFLNRIISKIATALNYG